MWRGAKVLILYEDPQQKTKACLRLRFWVFLTRTKGREVHVLIIHEDPPKKRESQKLSTNNVRRSPNKNRKPKWSSHVLMIYEEP